MKPHINKLEDMPEVKHPPEDYQVKAWIRTLHDKLNETRRTVNMLLEERGGKEKQTPYCYECLESAEPGEIVHQEGHCPVHSPHKLEVRSEVDNEKSEKDNAIKRYETSKKNGTLDRDFPVFGTPSETLEWEEEFDMKWHGTKGIPQKEAESVKSFISSLLVKEREKLIKWVDKNEYCSRCCSPKEYCTDWGEHASAIDTRDLLTQLRKD